MLFKTYVVLHSVKCYEVIVKNYYEDGKWWCQISGNFGCEIVILLQVWSFVLCYIGCLYSGESVEEEKKITWSSLPRFLYIRTLSDYVYVCQYHNISLVNWVILDYLLTGDLQCNWRGFSTVTSAEGGTSAGQTVPAKQATPTKSGRIS